MKLTKGRKRLKSLWKRGKGERSVTYAQSKKKTTGVGVQKKRSGPNAKAASMAASYKANQPSASNSGSTLKTQAKQTYLNAKSKVKSTYRMTAAHRKAISDGLKKFWGGGKK